MAATSTSLSCWFRLRAAQGSAGSDRGDFTFNINGAREDANNFLLDGIFNNDPKLNGFGVAPPVDAVREFEVLTNSYDASFGRTTEARLTSSCNRASTGSTAPLTNSSAMQSSTA